MNEKYGAWAFTAGIVLAVILGFVSVNLTWLLILLGLIVGFVNVTEKESMNFLVAAIAIVVTTGALGNLPLGTYLTTILGNVEALVSPAAIVVGLKAVWELGGKK